ncbi:glycosyltransferase family 32 protein [Cystobasidium minutum MCA 4210]|uniref:glycosyltransferase family 32 protein n=1 Tax=Cystobasidium minutum MCA 4210 TaxID=1397322 RepID=UPI0034CFB450|eukprot:jgi/Rhomi1/170437/fgenesh1_kg.4_\
MSTGTLIWSISLSLKTLQHESPKLEDSAVSPKLPFSTPTSRWLNSKYTPLSGSFVAVSPRQPPSAIRAACISRIKKFTVLFCFCFAFLRRQHIGSTLIYHPVNSPFLLTRLHSAHLDAELDDDSQTHNLPEGVDIMRSPTRYNETVVPNIVHFVFGMDETFGGKPFAFAHYLSMYSAMAENRPDQVFFWHHYLPSTPEQPNWWFERILQDAAKDFNIQIDLKKARAFDNIFGRPITEFAHKADIIRLEALLEYGGIYLDLDVYTTRSFQPLRHFDTTLGMEGGVASLSLQGLCNGVIVSTPDSPFLRKWYNSYRTFNKHNWAAHSVEKPLQLALRHPAELLVLDPYALFYPAWNDHGLRIVHSRAAEELSEGWDFEDSQQFAYHAWSKFAHKKWLSKLTPDKIFAVETSFNILMRRWTSESLREDWRSARLSGVVSK